MPNIPKILANALGGMSDLGFHALTLTKVTAGTRTAGSLSGGANPTTTDYACKGAKTTKRSGYWQFWQNAQSGTQARFKFLTISILGDTLPAGIEPMAGDRITSKGVVYVIAPDGVTKDQVGATYSCVVRAAGG